MDRTLAAVIVGLLASAGICFALRPPPRRLARPGCAFSRSLPALQATAAARSLTGAPGADLEILILARLARQAARTVRFCLVAAAPADDDQEVLVNPGDLGAGQAGQ